MNYFKKESKRTIIRYINSEKLIISYRNKETVIFLMKYWPIVNVGHENIWSLISVMSWQLDLFDTNTFSFSSYFICDLMLGNAVANSCPASQQFCLKTAVFPPSPSKNKLSIELFWQKDDLFKIQKKPLYPISNQISTKSYILKTDFN